MSSKFDCRVLVLLVLWAISLWCVLLPSLRQICQPIGFGIKQSWWKCTFCPPVGSLVVLPSYMPFPDGIWKFDVHFVLSLGLGQHSTYPTGLSNFHLHNCTWVYKWKIRNYQNQSPIRMSTTTYLVLNLHVLDGFLEHRDSVFFLLQAQIFDSILDVPS